MWVRSEMANTRLITEGFVSLYQEIGSFLILLPVPSISSLPPVAMDN
jgi:hypothetical protein